MGGFIVLEDGRAFAVATWAWSEAVRRIAAAASKVEPDSELGAWLVELSAVPAGYASLDVRELTPENRSRFHEATRIAIAEAEARGPEGWHDSSFFPAWLERFRSIELMRQSIARGESPMTLNPGMSSPIPPRGRICGPGWLEHLTSLRRADSTALVRWDPPVEDADLSGTRVDSRLLESLVMLPHLESLDLSRTSVTSAGVNCLSSLPRLKRVYVHDLPSIAEELPSLQSRLPFELIGDTTP